MSWTCATVPYRPGKNDLLEATRRVSAVLASGGVLAIAGEGRIHASEHDLLRLEEGPAYFALRSGVPLVPIAISGTSWLRLGRRVRVVVGEPIEVAGRPPPRGRRRADRAPLDGASRAGRGPPGLPAAGTRRTVGDRGLQRLAGRGAAARRAGDGLRLTPRLWHTRPVAESGLSADPREYRTRLEDQSDEQIDAWASELMRDVAIRRGVIRVVEDFRAAAGLGEREFERVFASGGGPPAVVGRDREGRLMVPAITLFALVPGIRSQVADGRGRLIEYLVKNFDELVYV